MAGGDGGRTFKQEETVSAGLPGFPRTSDYHRESILVGRRLRCFNTTCYRAVLQSREESIEDSELCWGKSLGGNWVKWSIMEALGWKGEHISLGKVQELDFQEHLINGLGGGARN